jgi:hypothetical protein
MKKKTINLKYYSLWKNPFIELINSTLSQRDIKKLNAIDPNMDCINYYDKAEELIGLYYEFDEIEHFLETHFSHITGYHATKLNNENLLKIYGMKTLSKKDYVDISLNLFGDLASVEKISETVNHFSERIENMNLEFSYFKDSYLDDFACLFLIYGSETLLCIANMINEYECRKRLRDRNVPVIYRCVIPISYLTDFDKKSLFKIMLSRTLRKIINSKIQFENTWCFELNRKYLESKYIKDYSVVNRRIIDLNFDHCEYQYTGK